MNDNRTPLFSKGYSASVFLTLFAMTMPLYIPSLSHDIAAILFWGSAFALSITALLWGRDVYTHYRRPYPQRFPILNLFDIATKHKIRISDPDKFVVSLQQAASDGKVPVWGRRRFKSGEAYENNPLELIPSEHWKDYKIDLRGTAIAKDGGIEVANRNVDIASRNHASNELSQFRDLHVGRQAVKWLKTS